MSHVGLSSTLVILYFNCIHCLSVVLLVTREQLVCSFYVRGLSFHLPLLLPGPRSLDSSGAEFQSGRGSVYR